MVEGHTLPNGPQGSILSPVHVSLPRHTHCNHFDTVKVKKKKKIRKKREGRRRRKTRSSSNIITSNVFIGIEI